MSLAALSFARPWWLLAVPSLALLLWQLWKREASGRAAWLQVADAHLLPYLLTAGTPQARRRGLVMLAGGLFLATLALAGPSLEQQTNDLYRRDTTRVLVLDLSPQMEAAPVDMERVRRKILALLRAMPEGQTALLIYAGEPYLVTPPTTDVETIARFAPELATGIVPVAGNRPERAMGMAAKILDRSGSAQRDVVWITAGQTGVSPPAAARLSILHVATAADPALAAAASHGRGRYVTLTADDSDVRQLVAALSANDDGIAAVLKGEGNGVDVGYWLLLPLLPLAALGFRRGLLALLLMPWLYAGLLLSPPPALAGDDADPRWRAVTAYRAGQFEQAAALLQGVDDADSRYNRGNALARQGRLADALSAYEAALQRRPDDKDILFNRDLVQRLLNPQASSGPQAQNESASQAAPLKPPAGSAAASAADQEAAQLTEQWLRQVPDEPGSLLRRKLLAEQRRRLAGTGAAPW